MHRKESDGFFEESFIFCKAAGQVQNALANAFGLENDLILWFGRRSEFSRKKCTVKKWHQFPEFFFANSIFGQN